MAATTNREELSSTVTHEQKSLLLKHVDIFKHLSEVERDMIAARFKSIIIDKDEVIFENDDNVNHFFVISKGNVLASKQCGTSRVETKELSRGNYFGGPPVYYSTKAQGTIRSTTTTICLHMDKKTFNETILPVLKAAEAISLAYHEFISSI
ncbi:unnamed protein product [Rotaria sp. Silwood2]|nr:unnamed protein product [Rotaria sp. Silwood2]